jgi:hypothetical protein
MNLNTKINVSTDIMNIERLIITGMALVNPGLSNFEESIIKFCFLSNI